MAHNTEISKKGLFLKWVKNILFLTLGAIVTAFALETFLVPKQYY